MGARVMQFTVSEPEAVLNAVPTLMLPLFLVPDKERLIVWAYDEPPRPQPGHKIIALVNDKAYETLVQRGAIQLDGSRVTVSPGIDEQKAISRPSYPVTAPMQGDNRQR
jgi:hypothetical protein